MYQSLNRQHRNLKAYLEGAVQAQKANRIIQLLQKAQEIDRLYAPKQMFLEEIDETQTVWDEEQDENLLFVPRKVITNLLDHYEIILIGTLSDFFPPKFTEELIDEIIRFLDLTPVYEYYSDLHKYFLPQGIMGYCFAVRNGHEKDFLGMVNAPQSVFSDFLTLNRTIKNDNNVSEFLKAFDNYNEIDTGRILSFLNSTESIGTTFDFDVDDPDKCYKIAAIGAVSFSVFTGRLLELLERTQAHPILQSVIWHYYGYYFDTMGNELFDFFQTTFDRLRNQVAVSDVFEEFKTMHDDERNLYARAISIIDDAEIDLNLIIGNKKKYSLPFKALASNYLQLEPA